MRIGRSRGDAADSRSVRQSAVFVFTSLDRLRNAPGTCSLRRELRVSAARLVDGQRRRRQVWVPFVFLRKSRFLQEAIMARARRLAAAVSLLAMLLLAPALTFAGKLPLFTAFY